MPPYAYAIIIQHEPQTVRYTDHHEIIEDDLTIALLAFAGGDPFTVERYDGGYTVDVYRTRLETEEERSARVRGRVAYMREYHKRLASVPHRA